MMKLASLSLAVIAIISCKKEHKPEAAKPEAAKPVEAGAAAVAPAPAPAPAPTAAPTAAPEAKLGAGESFAALDGDKNPLAWSTDGRQAVVAVIRKDEKVWARVYVASGQVDVTEPADAGDNATLRLQLANSGAAVHFGLRELAGRAPEVGALFSFEHRLITWDAAANTPVASDKWACDETTATDKKPVDCDQGPGWTSWAE